MNETNSSQTIQAIESLRTITGSQNTWENFLKYSPRLWYYAVRPLGPCTFPKIDDDGFLCETKEFEDKLIIKWSLPQLRGFQIPRPLHGKHSHHWAYETWTLLNKEGFLPILDYEYESPDKIDEERWDYLLNRQTRKILRIEVDKDAFILSSCCYTTFIFESPQECKGIKSFRSQFDFSEIDDMLTENLYNDVTPALWTIPNSDEEGLNNFYRMIDPYRMALTIKFRKTNDISFEQLEDYRCDVIDLPPLKNFKGPKRIYKGKLFEVVDEQSGILRNTQTESNNDQVPDRRFPF